IGAAGDPGAPPCGSGNDFGSGGVWYRFTGTGHIVTASLCTSSPIWDSQLNIYCGVNGCDNLICVDGNDDAGPGCSPLSRVAVCTMAGSTYYILVHGFEDAGNFILTLTDGASLCTPSVLCVPSGACCRDTGCTVMTSSACTGSGGTYLGDNSDCSSCPAT